METLALRSSTPGLFSSRRPSLKGVASFNSPSLTREVSAPSVSAARAQLTRKDTVESVSASAESAWNKVRVSIASVKAFEQIAEEKGSASQSLPLAALTGEQEERKIIK